MKVKNQIPPAIITAAVAMLSPFVPELSPVRLLTALQDYGEATEEDTRPSKPYTIPELMALLNVSKPTIYKLINNGTLKRIKAATCTRISAESVYRLLEGE